VIYPRFLGIDGSGDFVWELATGRWTWGDDPHAAATRERTFEPERYVGKYGRPVPFGERIDRQAEAEMEPAESLGVFTDRTNVEVEPFKFDGYPEHEVYIHARCGTVIDLAPGDAQTRKDIIAGMCDCETYGPWRRIYVVTMVEPEKRRDANEAGPVPPDFVHLLPSVGWVKCGNDNVTSDQTTERLSAVTCPRCLFDGDPVPRTRKITIERAHTEALSENAARFPSPSAHPSHEDYESARADARGLIEMAVSPTREADKLAGAVKMIVAMQEVAKGWAETSHENQVAMGHRDVKPVHEQTFVLADILNMINDAAREVGVMPQGYESL
jgi:hypothetical protein